MKIIILFILAFNLNANNINKNYYKYDYFFLKAANKYDIPFILLKAIALTENSKYITKIKRKNKNKTKDFGLMQINTIWLKEFNLTKEKLLNTEINIMTAARILHNIIKTYGYNWDAIGRYHSSTKKYKNKWIRRTKDNIIKIIKEDKKLKISILNKKGGDK
jgi:soluble lytic murein transglycosylase-like protein